MPELRPEIANRSRFAHVPEQRWPVFWGIESDADEEKCESVVDAVVDHDGEENPVGHDPASDEDFAGCDAGDSAEKGLFGGNEIVHGELADGEG